MNAVDAFALFMTLFAAGTAGSLSVVHAAWRGRWIVLLLGSTAAAVAIILTAPVPS